MSFNLQLSKSENIKAMFSAPKWLSLCNQFRLSIAKWWIIRSQQLSQLLDNDIENMILLSFPNTCLKSWMFFEISIVFIKDKSLPTPHISHKEKHLPDLFLAHPN